MTSTTKAASETSEPAEAAGPTETRAAMTQLSGRGYTKIRHLLIQLPRGQDARSSTVGRLLAARKHRALLLYLLVLTCWPWLSTRRKPPLEAAIWVRALTAPQGLTWSAATLSRAWKDLENAGLIIRQREGRAVRVIPRREDGAADYEVPVGATDRWNTYFALPDNFWHDEIFAKLSFPGLAMLLIIAGETSKNPEVSLAYDWAKERYGLSAKSAQNGIKDLEKYGLIHKREERISAPLSPIGYTTRIHYSLTGPYGQQARAALQKQAKSERAKRLRKAAAKAAASPAAKTARSTTSARTTPSSRRTSTRNR